MPDNIRRAVVLTVAVACLTLAVATDDDIRLLSYAFVNSWDSAATRTQDLLANADFVHLDVAAIVRQAALPVRDGGRQHAADVPSVAPRVSCKASLSRSPPSAS
jgi:hypothetical protein